MLQKIHARIMWLLRLNTVYVVLVADENDCFNQVLLTYDLCYALEALNEFNDVQTKGDEQKYRAMLLRQRINPARL